MIPDPFLRAQDSADALEEGYFLLQRRRARRVDIPIRIWFGAPLDPDTGEELDRSHRWQIMIGNRLVEQDPFFVGGISVTSLADIWPACRNDPIDSEDYAFRIERQEWAAEYDPGDAFATPGGKISPMTVQLPFQ